MSCLVRIRSLTSEFSSSEQKIAGFILRSPNVVRDLSSQKLAAVIGVSQSSVVKFSQKLGYRGYPDFKLALSEAVLSEQESGLLHGKITVQDSLGQVAEKLLTGKTAVLSNTVSLNDEETVTAAVQLLRDGRRIYISGIGASALVAKDFSYKLQKLGLAAFAENDSHVQLASVATFGKQDVLFAISQSGATAEIVELCRVAKEQGASVISLTRYGSCPVSDLADLHLYMATDDGSARLSSILARTAQELVIDWLFIGLTQMSKSGRNLLQQSNAAVASFYRAAKRQVD